MGNTVLFPAGSAQSCHYASRILENAGFLLTDHPSPDITHLLLDIPSLGPDGKLRDGSDLKELLRMLPKKLVIIGGNLSHDILESYQTIDLLCDPGYLAKNAAITAECVLRAAAPHLNATYADSPALILGWGRIGKCLARLLAFMGSSVTVAARKESDRAMLQALGYEAVDFSQISQILPKCRILFNTVPEPPLHIGILDQWKNCVKIDLASYPGLTGKDVITARGLPGKYAPESSGKLIAETILRIFREESV